MCWLRDVNVLGTVDVDGGTWGWQEAFHRLHYLLGNLRFSWSFVSSGIWVVLLDPLLHKDGSSLKAIYKLGLVFLLDLRKGLDSLPPLLLQEDLLGISDFHELLSA